MSKTKPVSDTSTPELQWNITAVADVATKCYTQDNPPQVQPVTQAVILASLAVQIGELTLLTVDEFATRIHLHEVLFGPIMYEGTTPRYITLADCINHIGLKTNVITVPPQGWYREMSRRLLDERLRPGLYADAVTTMPKAERCTVLMQNDSPIAVFRDAADAEPYRARSGKPLNGWDATPVYFHTHDFEIDRKPQL